MFSAFLELRNKMVPHPLIGQLQEFVRWKRRVPRQLPEHPLELTELCDELTNSIKKWREILANFGRSVDHSALAHAAKMMGESDTSPLVVLFTTHADAYAERARSEGSPQALPHIRRWVEDFFQGESRRRYIKLYFVMYQGCIEIAALADEYQSTYYWENGGMDALMGIHNFTMSLASSVIEYRKGLRPLPPEIPPRWVDKVNNYVAILEAHDSRSQDPDEEDDDDDEESLTASEIYDEMLRKVAIVSKACEEMVCLFEGLRREILDRLASQTSVGKFQTRLDETTAAGQKEIIILVHGIRTFASWQPMVKRVLEEIPSTKVIAIKYGYLDALRFWFPVFTRQYAINDIQREIQNASAANSDAQVSIIAHSFGTYAIATILIENPGLKFKRLVLSGSIIPRSYRWDYVRGRLANDVLNDYGTRDIWPVLAQCLSWGYGDTGRHGFGRSGVTDRGHNYTHSEFFNEKFVREYWKPWFENGQLIHSSWEEKAPPPSWFLSVLSAVPLQWISCLLVIAILLWLGRGVVY